MRLTSNQIVEVTKVTREVIDISKLIEYEATGSMPMLSIVETDIDIIIKELTKLKETLKKQAEEFNKVAEIMEQYDDPDSLKTTGHKVDLGYNPYQE